jgi:hypothetical protein
MILKYCAKNGVVLHTVKDERHILHKIKRRILSGLITYCVETPSKNMLLKERYRKDRRDGKTRKKT